MGEFVVLGGNFVFVFFSFRCKSKTFDCVFFSKACLFVALHPYQSYIQSSSKHWKPQQSTDQPNLLDLWGRLGFCLFWSACLPLRLFGATAPSGKFQWNIARRINETFHKYHKTPQSKKNMNFWLP